MSKFRDRTLECGDCHQPFTFTAGEQEFYQERGYSEPRRCPECRAARKASRTGGERPGGRRSSSGDAWGDPGGDRPQREMYDIVCASCGKPAQVPFRPRNDRPVYCRDCYEKQRQ